MSAQPMTAVERVMKDLGFTEEQAVQHVLARERLRTRERKIQHVILKIARLKLRDVLK